VVADSAWNFHRVSHHIISRVWDPFWDFLFCASSLLLAIFFARRWPTWCAAFRSTRADISLSRCGPTFRLGEQTGTLDWYTILVAVLALLALVMHGALWVRMKTTGPVNQRSAKLAANAWWGVLVLTAVVTTVNLPDSAASERNFVTWPWGFLFPLPGHRGNRGSAFRVGEARRAQGFLRLLRIFDRHAG